MKEKRNNGIKKFFATIFLLISVGVIVLSSWYIYSVLSYNNNRETYTDYVSTNNIDYKVYLEKNDFVVGTYQNSGLSYINQIVKHIDTSLKFEYENVNHSDVTYSYTIKGILNGIYSDVTGNEKDNLIWKEEETLKTVSTKNSTDGLVSLDENLQVDLQKLDNRVLSFQEKFGLPVNASYRIEFNVKLEFDFDGKVVTKEHVSSLVIPLNTDVFSVANNSEDSIKTFIYKEVAAEEMDKVYVVIAIALLGLSIITVILILKNGFKETRSKYDEELERIFKLYSDRIVTVENVAKKDDSEFIDLIGFEEMIELVNELNLPILCWNSQMSNETWFCAINGHIIYRYMILG